ncbi:MAG: DUF5812 family protein, partial [Halobaculum sp.]
MTDDSDDAADKLAEGLLDELDDSEETTTTAPDPTATATDGDAVESTFLVTAADEASAILQDVHTGQIHTLSENPDLVAESV